MLLVQRSRRVTDVTDACCEIADPGTTAMTCWELELVAALGAATALVRDAVAGLISVGELADRYGSFYYAEALDGHDFGARQN